MGTKTPTGRIRSAVCLRADGSCEACGVHVGMDGELGHLDHFFGRKHVPESVGNCWLLCFQCDSDKTNNRPRADWWCVRFLEHCGRYGYDADYERAETRLAVLAAKFPAKEVA